MKSFTIQPKSSIPPFLPDTPETREELAQYYQSCSRVDQGVARLVQILKEADLYDKTMIIFTSDHGMAFAGGKTTVYEGGLRVPMVVRDPYQTTAWSRIRSDDQPHRHHADDPGLRRWSGCEEKCTKEHGQRRQVLERTRRSDRWKIVTVTMPSTRTTANHGCIVSPIPTKSSRDNLRVAHVSRNSNVLSDASRSDDKYKLIWNIAYPLPYPFASDLWAASSWQAQWAKGQRCTLRKHDRGQVRPATAVRTVRYPSGSERDNQLWPTAAAIKTYSKRTKRN